MHAATIINNQSVINTFTEDAQHAFSDAARHGNENQGYDSDGENRIQNAANLQNEAYGNLGGNLSGLRNIFLKKSEMNKMV